MAERVGGALQNYSEVLFDVYQQECGDGVSFWDAEPGFEKYLSHRRFEIGPYNDIKNLNATSEEAVQVFKKYLSGGNCPDTSLRGQARQIASDFDISMRKTAARGADGDMHYTSDPKKLYANWQKYLILYLESVEQLKIAVDRFADGENLDCLVLNDLRFKAGRTEIIAQEMQLRLKEIAQVEFIASPEGTAIHSHYQRINNFRGIARFIILAASPGSKYVDELNEFIDLFQSGFHKLHNPFNWISEVTLEIFKETKSQVDLKVPKDPPALRTENTVLMWELIDRVAMSVVLKAKQDGFDALSFKWDPFKRHFVILSSTLGQEIGRVDQLLAVLKGSRSGVSPVEIRMPVKTVSKAPQVNQPPSGGKGTSYDEEITGVGGEDEMEESAPDEDLTFDAGFDVYVMPDVPLPFAETTVPFPL